MNFIVSFIFWKKYYNKKENSLRIILMRTTYLLIGFILTSFFLFIMKKEHNSLAIILFFIFLSSYNIAFIVFRNMKLYKKLSLLIILSLGLLSCDKKDNCKNSVEIYGKYINNYEKGAKDCLIIKKDGTFEQVYTKGIIKKTNKGNWKFFEDDCGVYFNTLKLLHNLPAQYREESIEGQPAIFRNNKIMFYEDMPFEYDYSRVED